MPDVQQQQQGAQGEQQPNADGGTPETWDAWLGAQPEDQRTRIATLYQAHEQGLRSALESERGERKRFEQQVRDLSKSVEKGSALEQQLNATLTQLETANRRADFVEQAAKTENGVADIAAAWIIASAQADTYFDRKGNVNFALLKQNHPTLFRGAVTPRANAGAGTGQTGDGKHSMNDFIRKSAGRG